jgi:thiol-disulfide isomerase/thioredoxin
VVLNFFAGLCPPCRAEMPDLQSVSAQYQGRVILFGLDIGPFVNLGSRKDGKALVRELGVTYPTGTTFDSKVVREYRVLGMPTTVFLTPDGKVFTTWTGLLTRGKMVELFEQLLKASGA